MCSAMQKTRNERHQKLNVESCFSHIYTQTAWLTTVKILHIHRSQKKKKVNLVIPVYLHLKHPDWACLMNSSCYLLSSHKERKNVKLVKIRTVEKYEHLTSQNMLMYVFLCSFVFFCGIQRIINFQCNDLLTGNIYIAYPVGKGLWSIRAFLHSVLNKTLTPYLGSNSTLNSLRVSQLTWSLANLDRGFCLTNNYTNSPSDSATDGLQPIK